MGSSAGLQGDVVARSASLKSRFLREDSLESAADVVSFVSAWGLAADVVAVKAAQAVESAAHQKSAVYQLALQILNRGVFLVGGLVTPQDRIAGLKAMVRTNPRDAISWIELSRWYSALGQSGSAKKAAHNAVSLVDSHRYILRSAARLMCHVGEPDRAQWMLERASRVRIDPWLRSALISVCDLQGDATRFSGESKALAARAESVGFHESELAAALGTIELEHGNPRKARRLLRAALVSPAENAIAQVSWANRRRGASIDLPNEVAMRHRCFEALAWDSAQNGNIGVAIENCQMWLTEEPFSVTPAILGSFFGVVSGLCLETAAQIAADGVTANPSHTLMANNLIVALLEVGKLQEAYEKLSRIRRRDLSPEMLVTLQATDGLLAFREGRPAEGEVHYKAAIERAVALGDEYLRDMAEIHLQIEKARLGQVSPDTAALLEKASVAGELGLRLAGARLAALLEARKRRDSADAGQTEA